MLTQLDGMFDIDALIHQAEVENAPAWTGAPLEYHEDYATPEQLDAAFDRWVFENGRHGCIPLSHMWHRNNMRGFTDPDADITTHQLYLFCADTRCDGIVPATRSHEHAVDLPGELMYQAICPRCSWHAIDENESRAVEAWHDHALPGWRSLPIVPQKLREHSGEQRALQRFTAWIEEHYPPEWQRLGYPILTERPHYGTRAVEGASPWKGYDISAPR